MQHSDASDVPDIYMILSSNPNRVPLVDIPGLPAEVLHQINEVYFVHTLATNASRILPPGKSLISFLSSRNRRLNHSQASKSLKDQVTNVITRVFWDEALETLSSQTAAVQLTRLRLLYEDIRIAVTPLIPSTHSIMYTLSNPLSPTSSPLRSASSHLRVLLSVLRERCAPARDANIDVLVNHLEDSSLPHLPQTIVATVKGILDLADVMKEDLADFVVGTWTEHEAQKWIRWSALDCERKAVMDIFSGQDIQESYREWLRPGQEPSAPGVDRFVYRLMEALSHAKPVSPFPPSENTLPPQFLFTAFDLVKFQNMLQALVITASLRSLVRPVDNSANDWLPRIWALLEAEVERIPVEPTEIRLLNLEDEVVSAAGILGDAKAEKELREAVQRTLRLQDPVFVLLQRRLVGAIRERLSGKEEMLQHAQIPWRMSTGGDQFAEAMRGEKDGQEPDLIVRGFEDEILKANVKRAVVSLRACIKWMEVCWGDIF